MEMFAASRLLISPSRSSGGLFCNMGAKFAEVQKCNAIESVNAL